MNDATLLSSRVAECNANSERLQHEASAPEQAVREYPSEGGTPPTPLSDDEREIAIKRAGEALTAAMGRKEAARRRYLESSCLTDRADMDAADMHARQALRSMEALIKGRSAAQVAKLERERGLA